MSRIIGIDLGTTNSLVAITDQGQPRVLSDDATGALLPSVVAYGPDGVRAVGHEAAALAPEAPGDVIFSVKRLMGRAPADLGGERASLPYVISDDDRVVRITVASGAVTPPEVSAEILKALKSRAEAQLGESITRAVITVPAYFDDAQRQATQDAGRLAGLEVERLVNEPTAASLAYGLQELRNGCIAVYDLGGGTFDVSILKLKDGIFEVLATAGDTHLGGDDIDRALAGWLAGRVREARGTDPGATPAAFDRLRRLAERAKVALTDAESAEVEIPLGDGKSCHLTVSRADLDQVARSIVERTGDPCRRALADAGLHPRDFDAVVLVGGSTRTPLVRAYVEKLFEQKPLCSLNPDEVVAMGAAVQADILSGGRDDLLLLDVCPLSLGIETMGGAVAKIIHRNSTIPASAREEFTTYADDQTAFDLHVLQGERELAGDCRSLARFQLRGLPPMPAGYARLQVTFLINPSGILEVRATETRSGASTQVEVKPSYGLTDEEVERMLIESIEYAEEDVSARLLVEARVEAEQVLVATDKAIAEDAALFGEGEREAVEGAASELRAACEGTDYHRIRDLLEKLDNVARPFVERRMDRAVSEALRDRAVEDVDTTGR